MLSTEKVRHVRELLEQGVSYRRIRQLTGVSRVTIGRIARRERPDYPATRPAEPLWAEEDRPAVRCEECGHRTVPPCRICRVRKAVADGTVRRTFGRTDSGEPLGLQLREDHQARYEKVRARRERERSRLARRLCSRGPHGDHQQPRAIDRREPKPYQ